jgi:hypothetical protein
MTSIETTRLIAETAMVVLTRVFCMAALLRLSACAMVAGFAAAFPGWSSF